MTMSDLSWLSEPSTQAVVSGGHPLGECFQKYSGFALGKLIGSGSFASVYQGSSGATDRKVAIKVEPCAGNRSKLLYEAKVYKSLSRDSDGSSPKVYWHEAVGDFTIMVMDLLGPSLEDVFRSCQQQLSPPQVSAIGVGVLSAVEYLHSKGFVHRNIKPANVMFSPNSISKVSLVGLCMAKKYIEKTQDHIAPQKNKLQLSDNAFSSLRSHLGVQQSRRDDVESVGLILLYLMKGSLPWAGMSSECVTLHKQALVLCGEDYCPTHISKFVQYARDLSFEKAPNYKYLRRLLTRMSSVSLRVPASSKRSAFHEYNFVSDWTIHVVPKRKHLVLGAV